MALSRTQLLTTLATTTVVRDPSPVNKAAPASPQWRRAAAARPLIRRSRKSFGYVLLGCGLVMIPWTLVLARTMPAPASVPHWAAAWVGLDALEALGFLTTGILAVANSDALRCPPRSPRRCSGWMPGSTPCRRPRNRARRGTDDGAGRRAAPGLAVRGHRVANPARRRLIRTGPPQRGSKCCSRRGPFWSTRHGPVAAEEFTL